VVPKLVITYLRRRLMMPSFKMILPNGKTVDMTKDIQQAKGEEDVRKVLAKSLVKNGGTK
jgi:hypothetical protein|tara:strand:- start:196 stop:375 length:180 start_codon:yes stop_codon:yes gene_type:complete